MYASLPDRLQQGLTKRITREGNSSSIGIGTLNCALRIRFHETQTWLVRRDSPPQIIGSGTLSIDEPEVEMEVLVAPRTRAKLDQWRHINESERVP